MTLTALDLRAPDGRRHIPEPRIVEMITLLGRAYEAGTAAAASASAVNLQAWLDLGLPYRCDAQGRRYFDPVEVSQFYKRVGLDGRDTFWTGHCIPTLRRMVTDLAHAAQAGPLPVELELRRVFNLRAIPPGTRLRLRAPLPLAGSDAQELQITPRVDFAAAPLPDVQPGRLELRLVTAGEAEVTLAARVRCLVSPFRPEPTAALGEVDRALYLKRHEGLIVVSDRLAALAAALAPSPTPPHEAVSAFWAYLFEKFVTGDVHHDRIDASSPGDWALAVGWCDCLLASAVFVALCRARGIPARIIGGCQLYRVAPAKHYWAEVWFDDAGWTPFDFLAWDLSRGGRDHEWRDFFFGRIDCRLTFERLPRQFTGPVGVPIPPSWCMLTSAVPGGVEIGFLHSNGTPIYTDTVRFLS